MEKKLWLVPLTVTVTAYVYAFDDLDAETVEGIAQGSVGLRSKTLGVILDHDNTVAGEAVGSVMQEETLTVHHETWSGAAADARINREKRGEEMEEWEGQPKTEGEALLAWATARDESDRLRQQLTAAEARVVELESFLKNCQGAKLILMQELNRRDAELYALRREQGWG